MTAGALKVAAVTFNRFYDSTRTIRNLPTLAVDRAKKTVVQAAADVVDTVIHAGSKFYYHHAAHRKAVGMAPSAHAEYTIFLTLGMTGFEKSPRAEENLARDGHLIRTLPRLHHLMTWRQVADQNVRYFIDHPDAIESLRIFYSHSMGEPANNVLGAMAKGADLARVRRAIPSLADIHPSKLVDLAARLQRARQQGCEFGSGGGISNGFRLSRLGRVTNWFVEIIAPGLLTELTEESLAKFYAELGMKPEEILDFKIVGTDGPITFNGDWKSVLAQALVQFVIRILSLLLEQEGVNDALAPDYAVRSKCPDQADLPTHHVDFVEDALITVLRERIQKQESRRLASDGNGLSEALSA